MPLISAGSASIFGPAFSFTSSSSTAPASIAPLLDNLFSTAGMPKGLHPVAHAESDSAPRTIEALRSMLSFWVRGHLERLRGTPHREVTGEALWEYVNRTLQYATDTNVGHAVAYHRAAMEAASHSPPLYDPVLHGPVARHEYLMHIHPHLGKASSPRGSRSSWKRTRATTETASSPSATAPTAGSQRTPKRSRGNAQADDRCTLHLYATHSNASCFQQQGGPPGGALPAPTPARAAAATLAAPRGASDK